MNTQSEPENLKSKEDRDISDLFTSRIKYSITTLILVVMISILLLLSTSFIISVFNLPAIAGLLVSLYSQKKDSIRAQKSLKLAIKIGVAKSVGGILLAVALYHKFGNGQFVDPSRNSMLAYIVSIMISAISDLLYIILSRPILKRTKALLRILKKREKESLKQNELIHSDSMSPKIRSP